MEQTFITIHNLTPDANILFASHSIVEILGYQREDVVGRSCFDYFHPDEVPFARSVHSRGILLDKAAVLHYARILSQDGRWVSCECCFTVVHDVLVACTSIYRRGEKSERRAIEGAQIRRIFSSSPRDPRYHMLEHLSAKFRMPPVEREPRAALILNRFTRNLSILFSTNAVASVLGLRPDQVQDKSFYRCIQENCLADAMRCLESAKANDSIAYLRFWSRDPRDDDDDEEQDNQTDDEDGRNSSNSDSEGGVQLSSSMDVDDDGPEIKVEEDEDVGIGAGPSSSRRPEAARRPNGGRRRRARLPSIELEAVVSCTSDGLVVVLRRARHPVPAAHPPLLAMNVNHGLFAAPWGQHPIQPQFPPEMLRTFAPPLLPKYMPVDEARGPPLDALMSSIRDVAVFAWALVGINGNLAQYTRGAPAGEAAPPGGIPVWDPTAVNAAYQPPENQAAIYWAQMEKGKGVQLPTPWAYPGSTYTADVPPPAYTQDGSYGLGNYTHGPQPGYAGAGPHQSYAHGYEPLPAISQQWHIQGYQGLPQEQLGVSPLFAAPRAGTPPPPTGPPAQDPDYRW